MRNDNKAKKQQRREEENKNLPDYYEIDENYQPLEGFEGISVRSIRFPGIEGPLDIAYVTKKAGKSVVQHMYKEQLENLNRQEKRRLEQLLRSRRKTKKARKEATGEGRFCLSHWFLDTLLLPLPQDAGRKVVYSIVDGNDAVLGFVFPGLMALLNPENFLRWPRPEPFVLCSRGWKLRSTTILCGAQDSASSLPMFTPPQMALRAAGANLTLLRAAPEPLCKFSSGALTLSGPRV